jgi:hypothetical protein
MPSLRLRNAHAQTEARYASGTESPGLSVRAYGKTSTTTQARHLEPPPHSGLLSPSGSVSAWKTHALQDREIRVFDQSRAPTESGNKKPMSRLHYGYNMDEIRRSAGLSGQTDLGGHVHANRDFLTTQSSWCVRMSMPEKFTVAAQERAKQVCDILRMYVCMYIYIYMYVACYSETSVISMFFAHAYACMRAIMRPTSPQPAKP